MRIPTCGHSYSNSSSELRQCCHRDKDIAFTFNVSKSKSRKSLYYVEVDKATSTDARYSDGRSRQCIWDLLVSTSLPSDDLTTDRRR